jgi:hypothetical protein
VHDVGIVLAGENITRAAHVGCELIDFIETAIDKMPYKVGVTKVAEYEIIGLRLAEAREFKIGPADPKTFALKTTDKVMSDKAASPTDQRLFSRCWCRRHVQTPTVISATLYFSNFPSCRTSGEIWFTRRLL